jgi:putative phosphoribosyl transferase
MRSPPSIERQRHVRIAAPGATLDGDLVVPDSAGGVVLFAHGSGSSRFSPRNRYVAEVLQVAGLGTLLMDLLTPAEEAMDVQTGHLRFDIGLLAERLVAATDWLRDRPATRGLALGYFGASTGGGAALMAAAERPTLVHAVVSRGGRPDLADSALAMVTTPTLLIVGERDTAVIEMNREAMRRMTGEVQLEVVPRATHLFEEPGTLDAVARLAAAWFTRYLRKPAGADGQRTASARPRYPRATHGQTILNPTEEDLSVLPTGEGRP